MATFCWVDHRRSTWEGVTLYLAARDLIVLCSKRIGIFFAFLEDNLGSSRKDFGLKEE